MSSASMLAERVANLLTARSATAAATWIRTTAAGLGAELTPLRIAIAQAPRKLGREALAATPDELARVELPAQLAAPVWRGFDLGRVALLSSVLARTPEAEHVDLVELLVAAGELGEQESLLRGLSLLPDPARYVELAVNACRTNAVSVFEAIACHNPYPAAHFSEHAFNQMVLKAVFLGVAVAPIVALDSRANPELRRMALGYASERRAAGRSVPEDIERIVASCP